MKADGARQEHNAFQLITRIRAAYWAALLLIAVIATASYAVIDDAIRSQFGGNTMVQMAGAQKMLSQRIVLLTNTATLETSYYRRLQSLNELRIALDSFETNYAFITAMHEREGGHSATVHDLIYAAPHDINYFTGNLIESGRRFLADAANAEVDAPLVPISQNIATASLSGYEALATQLAEEMNAGISRVRAMHRWLFTVMMMLLALEALFIFLPMIRVVRSRTSALVQAHNDMAYLANRDQLTGLYNRTALTERFGLAFNHAQETGGRLALVQIDADRFKEINDHYGHGAGDAALVALANRLTSTLRTGDVIARIGGDEFVVVLPSPGTPAEVRALANKLLSAICKPVEHEGIMLNCGFSLGVATFPEDGKTMHELSVNADLALYKAKSGGRNRAVHFSPEMLKERDMRLTNDKALIHAIRKGALETRYQPRVSLNGGMLTAFDGCIHWRAPSGVMMDMAGIVEVAERTDSALELAEIVLQETISTVANWRSKGLRFGRLSLTVSHTQLTNPTVGKQLVDLCRLNGVTHGLLAFDIPHRFLCGDDHAAIASARFLKSSGFHIETQVPDLSGNTLQDLAAIGIDRVKVPAAICGTDANDASRIAALRAFCDLAHGAGILVTAINASDETERALLRAAGCDEVAGPIAGSDMDASAARTFMEGNRTDLRERRGNARSTGKLASA